MVAFNTKGKKSYSEYTGRPPAPLPGRYHVIVEEADEHVDPNDSSRRSINVEFRVVCDKGTTPGQAGKVHREFFTINDKQFNIDRLCRLAMVFGLIGADEEKEVDFAQAKGAHLVIELFEDSYQGQKKIKIKGMGFWPIGDPEVKDVPIEQAMIGVTRPAAAAPTNGSAVTTPTPAASAVPVGAAAGGKWANL